MKTFDAADVAKHNTADSCWVIIYGHVYDVTHFLPKHPGGAKIILQLAGKDATEENDPVHSHGTLEQNLPRQTKLGRVGESTMIKQEAFRGKESQSPNVPPDLESLLNLDEIEQAATKQISTKAWAYYYSAADDLTSKRHNTEAYRSILLRPRMFVDCTSCDTSTTILGHNVKTPIYVSPAAMARLAHPAGELGIAQACAKFGAAQIISQNASMMPEQIVSEASGNQVFGWQLYVQTDLKKSEAMLARINKLADKIKFVVLTLDAPVPGKREDDERAKNAETGKVAVSKVMEATGGPKRGGLGAALFLGTAANLTWETTLPWLAKHTDLPIVLKGIQTHEDAYLATKYAPRVRGIILSNHGGRAADTAPPAVHTLLAIRRHCPEVFGKIEVYVDGGIKRGTDVVKALCLGARAVGIGRAALWGLGAGGSAGVDRTFDILQDELKTAMRLLGARNVADLGPRHINTSAIEHLIYDGPAFLDKNDLWSSSKL